MSVFAALEWSMTGQTKAHLTVIGQADRVTALAPVITDIAPLVAAVVAAAQQWADEADALASLMGWSPSESNDLGKATLRLLDAVRMLEERGLTPGPAG